MVILGPADGSQLLEICRSIVAIDYSRGNEVQAGGKQIYETFKHIVVRDVTIMKPNSVKQYKSARLEQLQARPSLLCSPLPPPMTNWGLPSNSRRIGSTPSSNSTHYQFQAESARASTGTNNMTLSSVRPHKQSHKMV